MMVDDNPRFLTHLSACLDQSLHFSLCVDPLDAIQALNKEPLLPQVVNQCFSLCDELEEDNHELAHDIYLSSLHHLIYKPSRFEEVSVIIVDYSMPSINGLDFCRKIKDHPAKKIMLTGEADHRLAVEAFNEGLIDRFILKQADESTLHDQLNAAIKDMMKAYFESVCTRLQLGVNLSKVWKMPSYQTMFGEVCSVHDIQEYYLLNSKGSLLLVDDEGEHYWLLIEDAASIDNYARMAAENEAPIDVVAALTKHSKIPFFFLAEDQTIPFSEWSRLLYPSKHLDYSGLYYAFQMGDQLRYVDATKISSYKSFIENEELAEII